MYGGIRVRSRLSGSIHFAAVSPHGLPSALPVPFRLDGMRDGAGRASEGSRGALREGPGGSPARGTGVRARPSEIRTAMDSRWADNKKGLGHTQHDTAHNTAQHGTTQHGTTQLSAREIHQKNLVVMARNEIYSGSMNDAQTFLFLFQWRSSSSPYFSS